MTKDYYKILGITDSESAVDIKLAYRKLARKWHPDVAGNTPEAINRFKELNEAYEVLSNPIKKREYDRAKSFYTYAQKNTHYQETKTTQNFKSKEPDFSKTFDENLKKWFSSNWEEFISKSQQNKKTKKSQPQKGEDIYTDIEITAQEAFTGTSKTINMLQTHVCEKCGGRKFVNGVTCKHCKGKGEFVDYKKFTVKIPAGIKNNSKIRLAGEGGIGINGAINGDLYIIVHVKEKSSYKIEGLNIIKIIPITPAEAVCGADIHLASPSGKLNLKISPNTQNGQKFRLAGCGIVQNNVVGDMIVTVEIQIPKNLSAEELALYKKLNEISTNNVRDNFYDK